MDNISDGSDRILILRGISGLAQWYFWFKFIETHESQYAWYHAWKNLNKKLTSPSIVLEIFVFKAIKITLKMHVLG